MAKTSSERIVVAVVSDLHINSTIGLCPPTAPLDDGGTYEAGAWQRELWRAWQDFWGYVRDKRGTSPLYVIVNGDAIDVDGKGRSHQIITRNRANALAIAQEVMSLPVELATGVIFIRGTEAHVGKSAAMEEMLAADTINAERYSKSVASWWHWRGRLGGTLFDVRHHPPGSVRNPLALAQKIRDEYVSWNEPTRNVVALFGHTHCFYDSGEITTMRPRVFGSGCWTGHGAHGWRSGFGGQRPQIGGLVFVASENKLEAEAKIYETRRQGVWTAK